MSHLTDNDADQVRNAKPQEFEGVSPELSQKINQQLGLASIALAQAVTDIATAAACAQVERLRTQCRIASEHTQGRIDVIENFCKRVSIATGVPFDIKPYRANFEKFTTGDVAGRLSDAVVPKTEQRQ